MRFSIGLPVCSIFFCVCRDLCSAFQLTGSVHRDLCSAFQSVIVWVCQDLRFGGLYSIRGANCIFQQVEPLPITWTQLGALLGRCQPQGNHTFSAFWLRSSVVSVLISLISGTCYTVANEINCYV